MSETREARSRPQNMPRTWAIQQICSGVAASSVVAGPVRSSAQGGYGSVRKSGRQMLKVTRNWARTLVLLDDLAGQMMSIPLPGSSKFGCTLVNSFVVTFCDALSSNFLC